MGKNSKIAWTDHTFNPWWGCVRVSEGCKHCYAESFDHRLGGKHWGEGSDRRFFGEKHWNDPIRWNRIAEKAGIRYRVFCASMADVFEDHPELEFSRNRLWELITKTPYLDWLLLTKRPENLKDMLPWHNPFRAASDPRWGTPWSNIWLGVTAENQKRLDERLLILQDCAAIVRFVSYEPALGPLSLENTDGVHWIIAGAESGTNARPMDENWVRDLRDACVDQGIAFFYKQRIEDGSKIEIPLLDGVRHVEFPESKNV